MRVIWQSGSLSSQSATEEHFVCVCVQAAGLAGMITRSQTLLVSSAFHQRVFLGQFRLTSCSRHIDVWTQPRGVVFGLLRWHVSRQPSAETNRAGCWEYGSFLASQLSYSFPFHPILKRFWQHMYDKGRFLWAMPMRFIGTFSEVQDLKMGA